MNYIQKQAALQKLAQMRLAINFVARQRLMQKQADAAGSIARTIPQALILNQTGIPQMGVTVGSLAGALEGSNDLDSVVEGRKNVGLEFLPGVTPYHIARQRRVVENALKKNKNIGNKTLSEVLGSDTSALGLGAAGAGIGALLGGPAGAAVGGLGGLGAGVLAGGVGALGTLFTKGRDKKDLEEYYNNDPAMLNYLIPGRAAYNAWKNIAATDRLMAAYEADKEKNKKSEKATDAQPAFA